MDSLSLSSIKRSAEKNIAKALVKWAPAQAVIHLQVQFFMGQAIQQLHMGPY